LSILELFCHLSGEVCGLRGGSGTGGS
jgi:hypothetical protein